MTVVYYSKTTIHSYDKFIKYNNKFSTYTINNHQMQRKNNGIHNAHCTNACSKPTSIYCENLIVNVCKYTST